MIDLFNSMIDRFAKNRKNSKAFDDQDTAKAIAALFKQMVMADGVVRQEELGTAIQLLVKNYSYLNKTDDGSKPVDHFSGPSNDGLISLWKVLNKTLDRSQKLALKEQLYLIATSDSEFHPDEKEFLAITLQNIRI